MKCSLILRKMPIRKKWYKDKTEEIKLYRERKKLKPISSK